MDGFVEIVIGKSDIHFHGMLDLGTECKRRRSTMPDFIGTTHYLRIRVTSCYYYEYQFPLTYDCRT
jgi:hypothetical protein